MRRLKTIKGDPGAWAVISRAWKQDQKRSLEPRRTCGRCSRPNCTFVTFRAKDMARRIRMNDKFHLALEVPRLYCMTLLFLCETREQSKR